MAGVTGVVVFQPAVRRLLEDPTGPVGDYLQRKAGEVDELAAANASGPIIGVLSGDLLGGIQFSVGLGPEGLVARIGTNAEHREFNYPAWHDQNGRPWLSDALRAAFA